MANVAVTGLSGANSFQGFLSLARREAPSYNNLYWVRFRSKPKVLDKSVWFNDFFNDGNTSGPGTDKSRLLTYYATDVTVPSRQLTTGEIKSVGSMWRYPTSTTFSEVSVQFIVPRTYKTRTFFERWMNYTANDASQRVSWYDDVCTSYIDIFKYERGGANPYDQNAELSLTNPSQRNFTTNKWNKCVGVWTMKNAFPFNISSMQLQSGPANYATMEVSFYFERYRFYVPNNDGIEEVAVSLGSKGVAASAAAQQQATAAGPGPQGVTPTIITSTSGQNRTI
ncbi:tail tube protein [Synechococcus phage S-CREM1]|nr:tail tube protein [Synechococcus phage S-CREM1]